MTINSVTNESILDQYGGVCNNSLDHILSLDNDDESELFQTSNYYSVENMADIFSANINSFNILYSLNCQSIIAKIDNKAKRNEKQELRFRCNMLTRDMVIKRCRYIPVQNRGL